MKFVIVLMLTISISKATAKNFSQEKSSAIETITAIFPNLAKSNNVKTAQCQFDKQKWINLLLTQKSFIEKLSFNSSCDLQGKHEVKMNEFFNIDLKIKNLKDYDQLKSKVKFSILFEDMPVLKVEMNNALLSGNQKNISFDMDYAVIVDVMNAEPLQKHKGGTLHLKKSNNKFINKKIPLLFSK